MVTLCYLVVLRLKVGTQRVLKVNKAYLLRIDEGRSNMLLFEENHIRLMTIPLRLSLPLCNPSSLSWLHMELPRRRAVCALLLFIAILSTQGGFTQHFCRKCYSLQESLGLARLQDSSSTRISCVYLSVTHLVGCTVSASNSLQSEVITCCLRAY